MNRKADRGEVRLLNDCRNERGQQALNQGVYDIAKGCSDDDAHGEIHHIAPEQKLFESFHAWAPVT